jgi:hypothetical protein
MDRVSLRYPVTVTGDLSGNRAGGFWRPASQELWYTRAIIGPPSFFRLRGQGLEKTADFFRYFPGPLFFGKELRMFFSSISRTKKFLPRNVFSLFLAACLVMGSALIFGCDLGGDSGGGGIYGTWKDPQSQDTYKITSTTISYNSAYPEMDFAGTIVPIDPFDNSSGVIIFKYTKGQPTTGRTYGAVYYRGLTASQMTMATAGRWESAEPYGDLTPVITSEDQAKREFIRDKGDGYYVNMWGGPYVKQ